MHFFLLQFVLNIVRPVPGCLNDHGCRGNDCAGYFFSQAHSCILSPVLLKTCERFHFCLKSPISTEAVKHLIFKYTQNKKAQKTLSEISCACAGLKGSMLQQAAQGWESHRISTTCQELPAALGTPGDAVHTPSACSWSTGHRALQPLLTAATSAHRRTHVQRRISPQGMWKMEEPMGETQSRALLSAGNVTPYIGAACPLCLQALGITVSCVRRGLVCPHSSQLTECFHPACSSSPVVFGAIQVCALVGGFLPVHWNDI